MRKLPSRWPVRQRQDQPDLFDWDGPREAPEVARAARWIARRWGVAISVAKVMATGAGFGDRP